jgi:hypothetical protein
MLREALYRIFSAIAAERQPPATDVALLDSFDKQAIAETKHLANIASLPSDAEIAPEWDADLVITPEGCANENTIVTSSTATPKVTLRPAKPRLARSRTVRPPAATVALVGKGTRAAFVRVGPGTLEPLPGVGSVRRTGVRLPHARTSVAVTAVRATGPGHFQALARQLTSSADRRYVPRSTS